ncbi:MAG: endonuclease NucS [Candidatus Woesearchaeota archaeon]
MKLGEYAIILDNAIKKKESIIMLCSCTVNYSGRAESYLSKGDRIVIIKEDTTLLVHQPKGSNPINYMKYETSHDVSLNKGVLKLSSRNLALKEYMDILIHEVYSLRTRKMEDNKTLILQGTEKDMAEMIFNNPEMIEKGFKPLTMEEHIKFGFIDVFGHDKDNILTIIECKRYNADFSAVSQLQRYVKKVKESRGVPIVRGVLAAPRISPNAKEMLEGLGYKFVKIEPPMHLERFNKNQKTLDAF